MRRWLIQWAIREIKRTGAEERSDILQMAVKDLFLPINPDDILTTKDGKWYFMQRELRQDEVERLKEEAKILNRMKLWSVLKWDVRYHLSRKMFEEGRIKEDFVWGQLATFLWDIMKTRINQLGSLK